MYTFIFNQDWLKINFSSVNSPGWTDDSHGQVGMGWISTTGRFVAQSQVEQLCLKRLDTLHFSARCGLVPGTIGCFCQKTEWFWKQCTPALVKVAEGARVRLLLCAVFGGGSDVSCAWPPLSHLHVCLRLTIPNCKWRLTFHLPASPGHFQETVLQNMVWPRSQSYYWTIKVILSLQIHMFMPFFSPNYMFFRP